ncbi:hypothetical protein EDC04DRAFT_2566646, partial [Pisolithus marmoratus]
LVCVNWPNAVLFLGQEHSSHSKPKGISDLTMLECTQIVTAIQDHGQHRLHFKFDPNSKLISLFATKANIQLADLLASKKPVILGALPLYDSKSTNAKRIFYNGKTNFAGPVCLSNPAMT